MKNVKSKYAKKVDIVVRSLSFYLSEIAKDFVAINCESIYTNAIAAAEAEADKAKADAAKKAAAKAKADAASHLAKADAERIELARETFATYKIALSDISYTFLKTNYPFVNAAGQICDVKKIAAEEEPKFRAEAEKIFEAAKNEGKERAEAEAIVAKCGYQFMYVKDNVLARLEPTTLWTANKVLSKLAAAKKAAAAKAAAKAAAEAAIDAAAKDDALLTSYEMRIAEIKQRKAAAEAAKPMPSTEAEAKAKK